MLVIDSIEDLLREKNYEDAKKEIKTRLREESDNPILFYYLFLAENEGYLNLKREDLSSEINFNKALELASPRLKLELDAEFGFFKAAPLELKYFVNHILREDIHSFYVFFKGYKFEKKELDSSLIEHLEVLVFSRLRPLMLDMYSIVLNLLYLETDSVEILRIYKELKDLTDILKTPISGIDLLPKILEFDEPLQILLGNKPEKVKIVEEWKRLNAYSKELDQKENAIAPKEAELKEKEEELKEKEEELKKKKELLDDMDASIKLLNQDIKEKTERLFQDREKIFEEKKTLKALESQRDEEIKNLERLELEYDDKMEELRRRDAKMKIIGVPLAQHNALFSFLLIGILIIHWVVGDNLPIQLYYARFVFLGFLAIGLLPAFFGLFSKYRKENGSRLSFFVGLFGLAVFLIDFYLIANN